MTITWTDNNSWGSFGGTEPGALWVYSPGVGSTPCATSSPGGTITMTIARGGQELAKCVDTHGWADYGSQFSTKGPSAPGCTSAGTGVAVTAFWAQAYDSQGDPTAANTSGGNYYWTIAILIVILAVVVFLLWWEEEGTIRARSAARWPGYPRSGLRPAG